MTFSYLGLVIILPLLFGLSAFLMFITYKQLEILFLWMIIIGTFFVYAGLMPFWILIILIITSLTLVSIKFTRNRSE